MSSKCPGSNKNITSEMITCPFCGIEVELFSDEAQRPCPGCRKMVFHDILPGCFAWCSYAKECLDLGRWLEYQESCRDILDKKKDT